MPNRAWLALLVAAVATLGVGVAWRLSGSPPGGCGGNGVNSVWTGDSYPAGRGVGAGQGYAHRVGRALDWELTLDAQGSTGFLADGYGRNTSYQPLPARLDGTKATAGPNVHLVVVDSGRNDVRFPPDEVEAAAASYLRDIQKAWPEARVVVVIPWLVTGEDEPSQLLSAIREAASAVRVEVIDPAAQGWVTGEMRASPRFDGVHPTLRGHELLADRFEQALCP